MIQESELFNLLMAAIGLLVFRVSLQKVRFQGAACFRYGFISMILSFGFTIVEGYLWQPFFNLLEHMAFALAGILFCAGCWQLMTRRRQAAAETTESR